ncbi:MAG: hypothetical protein ACYC0X_29245 [Pirellulaceae bacterium]
MLRSVCSATLALVASACLVPAAWGGIITPTGLVKGDQFRIVFVTNGTTQATSSDIGTYDGFVTTAATTAGLDYFGQAVTWKAIASTTTANALSQVGTNSGPLYLLDGTLVSSNLSSTTFGSLLHAINLNENGQTVNDAVWTGTNVDGTATPQLALGYSQVVNGTLVATSSYGISSEIDKDWIFTTVQNTNQSVGRHLYGISSIITAVPEPGCLTLWACGLAVFGAVAFVRRRRVAS